MKQTLKSFIAKYRPLLSRSGGKWRQFKNDIFILIYNETESVMLTDEQIIELAKKSTVTTDTRLGYVAGMRRAQSEIKSKLLNRYNEQKKA